MSDQAELEALLLQLNAWEQKYGPLGGAKGMASSGEAPARIADLKQQIAAMGMGVVWNGQEYALVPLSGSGP